MRALQRPFERQVEVVAIRYENHLTLPSDFSLFTEEDLGDGFKQGYWLRIHRFLEQYAAERRPLTDDGPFRAFLNLVQGWLQVYLRQMEKRYGITLPDDCFFVKFIIEERVWAIVRRKGVEFFPVG